MRYIYYERPLSLFERKMLRIFHVQAITLKCLIYLLSGLSTVEKENPKALHI